MTPSEKPAPKMRCAASTSSAPSPTERLKKEWWAHDHGEIGKAVGDFSQSAVNKVWVKMQQAPSTNNISSK